MNDVRCRTCHRVEDWSGDEPVVKMEGGVRKPSPNAPLAAWRVLVAARRGNGAVVGVCSRCDQPLVAASGESIPWVLETASGSLQVGETVVGPHGVMPDADVELWLAEATHVPLEIRPGLALFQGSLLSLAVVPVALWAVCCVVVVFFLMNVFAR